MKQLFGGLLMAVGVLIAGASGTCSLYFLRAVLVGLGKQGVGFGFLIPLFGGPPLAGGIGLVILGRRYIREYHAERSSSDDAGQF